MPEGVLKIARRIWQVGVAGWPVTGRRRGRSQYYCGCLDYGLPMVAFWFWRHNANANVSEYMRVLALCLVYDAHKYSGTKHTFMSVKENDLRNNQ